MTEEFQSTSRKQEIIFQQSGLQPASQLYIQKDDLLTALIYNSATGIELFFGTRMLMPDGQIIPAEFQARPTADRTLNQFRFTLPEGFLLGVTAGVRSAGPLRGQCFVILLLQRSFSTINWIYAGTLFQDYVSFQDFNGWPQGSIRSGLEGPGFVRSITGTDPAAGAEISETVPTNARWRPIALRFRLVTDATVANRRPGIVLDDGATAYFVSQAGSVQTASLTYDYNAGTLGFTQGVFSLDQWIPLPHYLLMPGGHRIRTSTVNLAAGDNYGAPQLLVEEWIED